MNLRFWKKKTQETSEDKQPALPAQIYLNSACVPAQTFLNVMHAHGCHIDTLQREVRQAVNSPIMTAIDSKMQLLTGQLGLFWDRSNKTQQGNAEFCKQTEEFREQTINLARAQLQTLQNIQASISVLVSMAKSARKEPEARAATTNKRPVGRKKK